MVTVVETMIMIAESRSTTRTMPSSGSHPPTCITCGPRLSAAHSSTPAVTSIPESTIMLPLVGAGLTLAAAGRTWVQRAVSMTVLSVMLVTAGVRPAPTRGSRTMRGTSAEKWLTGTHPRRAAARSARVCRNAARCARSRR